MEGKPFNIEYNTEQTVKGIYTKSFISKKESSPHKGYYKIVVDDSLEISLLPPYMPKAIRSKTEVHNFEGKMVAVTGIIVKKTSISEPTIEEQPLSVNIPCFISIESIRLSKK